MSAEPSSGTPADAPAGTAARTRTHPSATDDPNPEHPPRKGERAKEYGRSRRRVRGRASPWRSAPRTASATRSAPVGGGFGPRTATTRPRPRAPRATGHSGRTTPTAPGNAAPAAGRRPPGLASRSPSAAKHAGAPAGAPAGRRPDRVLRFQVLGPDGRPWTRYDRAHDKDPCTIIVAPLTCPASQARPPDARRGRHVARIPLTFAAAGDYRVFADFHAVRRPGRRRLTLGADVAVPGDYRTVPLPAPSRTAEVDGYHRHAERRPGDLGEHAHAVGEQERRAGHPTSSPTSARAGHLVALRQGDLAYLHVHPEGAPGDGKTPAGPGISFHAEAPSAGTYRLYLDFRHEGVVRTAEFTVTVNPGAAPPASPTPSAPNGPSSPSNPSGAGGEARRPPALTASRTTTPSGLAPPRSQGRRSLTTYPSGYAEQA
ncbi:hypothetical protein ACU686_22275 [Yinghuangia aomiensis]